MTSVTAPIYREGDKKIIYYRGVSVLSATQKTLSDIFFSQGECHKQIQTKRWVSSLLTMTQQIKRSSGNLHLSDIEENMRQWLDIVGNMYHLAMYM
jgi:hypothetical protein